MEVNLNTVLNEYQQQLASVLLRAIVAESLVAQYQKQEQEAAALVVPADQD